MTKIIPTLGAILCGVASYQVLTDANDTPIVSAALGFAVGWLVVEVLS